MPKRGARGLEQVAGVTTSYVEMKTDLSFPNAKLSKKARHSSLTRGQAAGFSQGGADGGGGPEAGSLGSWGLPGGKGTQKMQIMTLQQGTNF